MITTIPVAALLLLGAGCSWFGCMVPFAALAASAALSVRRRVGAALVCTVWALNQVTGFAFHQYPHDASTYAWGAGLLVASLVAFAAARAVRVRPILALLAAFAAFEIVLVAFSLVLGGWEAYAPSILANLLFWNLIWFAVVQVATSAVLRRPIFAAVF